MTIAGLRALVRECGLRGYSRLRKAESIAFLQENLEPRLPPEPTQQALQSIELTYTRPPLPLVKPQSRPPKPTRPPPQPPNESSFHPYNLV